MRLEPNLQPTLLSLAKLERAQEAAPAGATSAEQQALDQAIAEHSDMRSATARARMAVEDMENEILRIQEDERKLRKREREDRRQLEAETDPDRRRDLEHDRYSAKSRIADLMSELQEAHNEINPLRNNVETHEAKLATLASRVEELTRARDEALNSGSTPDDELEALRKKLPDDVLAAYLKRREENGIGAASFSGRACKGCFVVLPPADADRIRGAREDELPECPNCGSYLVRESRESAA